VTEPRKALILLVDDCADTREMYAEFLSASFEVAEASTGGEALRKASELRPRAIVMDLALPDMGGEDVIFKLKGDRRTEGIPVVVVSGFQERRDEPKAWDAYLVKPCNPDSLSACLDRLIESASR
jgi:two-component system, cell cycle response regulator DivK